MHSRFTRKGIHRRVAGLEPESEMEKRDLTGPITLTVAIPLDTDTPIPTPQPPPTILPPQSLESPPPASTLSSSSLQSSTTPQVPLGGISTPGDTSSSSPTSPSSAMTASFTIPNNPTGVISAGNDPQDTQHTPKLSSGAIAGIVIGCLIVLIIATALGLRKRTVSNRLKLRGRWVGSKSLQLRNKGRQSRYEAMPDLTNNGRRSGENMGFVGKQGASLGQPTSPRALPSAYGSEGMNSSGLSSQKIPVLYDTVVARSYVPTLPDELAISTGETLKVLQEFDDGWSECMNSAGEVGMVPLECFGKERGLWRQTSLGR